MKSIALSCLLGAAGACGPALVEPPPSPPSTLRVVQEAGCFSGSDCSDEEICIDPRYPVCGNVPACEEAGLIACGCACKEACTADSCGVDEVCGASGCCQARPCTADAQCGTTDSRCVGGRCIRRGTCGLPPP
jgi:hypothetical protein